MGQNDTFNPNAGFNPGQGFTGDNTPGFQGGQGNWNPYQNTNTFNPQGLTSGQQAQSSNNFFLSPSTPSQNQSTPVNTQQSTQSTPQSAPNQNTGGGGGMVTDSGSAGYTPPSNQMLDPRQYAVQGTSSDAQRIAGGYTLATNNPGVFINPQTGATWNTPGMGYVDNKSTFGTSPTGLNGSTLYNLPGGQYLADPKTGKVSPVQQQMQEAQQAQTSQDQGSSQQTSTPTPLGPGGTNPQSQGQNPQQFQQQLLQALMGYQQFGSGQQSPQQMIQMLLGSGGNMGMLGNNIQNNQGGMNPMAMMLMGQNPFAQMMMGGGGQQSNQNWGGPNTWHPQYPGQQPPTPATMEQMGVANGPGTYPGNLQQLQQISQMPQPMQNSYAPNILPGATMQNPFGTGNSNTQQSAPSNPDLNNIYGLDANSRALWGY